MTKSKKIDRELAAEFKDKKLRAEISTARRNIKRTGGVPAEGVFKKFASKPRKQ